jgi:AraC-like DNA-binding protein/mannose-6-phosphate isomerase-like protein (cupin superfamily)
MVRMNLDFEGDFSPSGNQPGESLLGSDINLSLVSRVSSIRRHGASRITWHAHDCYEILLLLDGATAYEFRNQDAVELTGGHFMVIPPGTYHRGVSDVRRPVNLTGLMFEPDSFPADTRGLFLMSEVNWLNDQFELSGMRCQRMGSELSSLVKAIPREFSTFDPCHVPNALALRLAVCSILLLSAKQLVSLSSDRPEQTVQIAIAFMKAHLAEGCSIEAVAKHAHCCRARLFKVFKDSTGMTPNDYWQRLRIDLAQELLAHQDSSITQIALDCGFSSSQYFSTVFRKYVGLKPSDYRAMHQDPQSALAREKLAKSGSTSQNLNEA